MSSITGLISGGGGGGTPVNSIARLSVDGQVLYTDESNGVWLKTGFGITPDSVTYPDAEISLALSAASFTQSFSVAANENFPLDIAFNNDGTKMFICGSGSDGVSEYALGTPFDISTASFTHLFSTVAQDNLPLGIDFNNDGTKMFILGRQLNRIYEYALATAFNVSTASFTTQLPGLQDSNPQSLRFNNDGTKMYITGVTNPGVYEYALGTAFSISTASFSKSFSVASEDNSPWGIAFNNDGTKMFVLGSEFDRVYQYNLGVAFDVSSAYFIQSFSVALKETSPQGLTFNNDGTKMFIVGSQSDSVHQYSIPELMGLTANTGAYDYVKLK